MWKQAEWRASREEGMLDLPAFHARFADDLCPCKSASYQVDDALPLIVMESEQRVASRKASLCLTFPALVAEGIAPRVGAWIETSATSAYIIALMVARGEAWAAILSWR